MTPSNIYYNYHYRTNDIEYREVKWTRDKSWNSRFHFFLSLFLDMSACFTVYNVPTSSKTKRTVEYVM